MVWKVRPVALTDEQEWRSLYRGYRESYEMQSDEKKVDVVWDWVRDAQHEVQGFVAEDENGELVGLANVRRFSRPLSATTGLYLDDLFTRTDRRGQGIGRALLDHLEDLAEANQLSVVRWITADSNAAARILYDAKARQTTWVTYDMP